MLSLELCFSALKMNRKVPPQKPLFLVPDLYKPVSVLLYYNGIYHL